MQAGKREIAWYPPLELPYGTAGISDASSQCINDIHDKFSLVAAVASSFADLLYISNASALILMQMDTKGVGGDLARHQGHAMRAATVRKPDRRTEATRLALIASAERLFAQRGLEGVSLREIAAASGTGNTSAVSYHFGTKQDLVAEIIAHRLPAIEARRAELWEQERSSSLVTLCDVLWRPFLEQTDTHGRHTYAAFLAGLMRSGQIELRGMVSATYPVTQSLVEEIERRLPDTARVQFGRRLTLTTAIVAAALQAIDDDAADLAEADARFGDAIQMAAAALAAPVNDPDNRSKFTRESR